jgi:hypothetical protein
VSVIQTGTSLWLHGGSYVNRLVPPWTHSRPFETTPFDQPARLHAPGPVALMLGVAVHFAHEDSLMISAQTS